MKFDEESYKSFLEYSWREKAKKLRSIHPDFQLVSVNFLDPQFAWNKRILEQNKQASVKVIFAFDEPKLLDDCPFLAKVGFDKTNEHTFFGVAYDIEGDPEKLCEWVAKFPRAELLEYDGRLIKDILERED